MPRALTPQDDQDQIDEDLIRHTFSTEGADLLNDLNTRDLDQSEKLPEAVDFADLSDDDLADDESDSHSPGPTNSLPTAAAAAAVGPACPEQDRSQSDDAIEIDAHTNELDDLFREKSPVYNALVAEARVPTGPAAPGLPGLRQLQNHTHAQDAPAHGNLEDFMLSKEQQLQQDMFAQSAANFETSGIPRPPENDEELLASLWPKYQRDTVPKFLELIIQKPGNWPMKVPPKLPKPLSSTKLSLDLAHDQERTFRVCLEESRRTAENTGYTIAAAMRENFASQNNDDDDDDDMRSDFEDERVCGVAWHDLQLMCEDWNAADVGGLPLTPFQPGEQDAQAYDDHLPQKKRKTGNGAANLWNRSPINVSSMHDPTSTTARIAGKIVLDLNDSRLLIDHSNHQTPYSKRFSQQIGMIPDQNLKSPGLNGRYNISNDEAYDLLKENHQHKVRGTLGIASIEHSLPAVRLQWPFYKTKLDKSEARSFHRPPLRTIQHELVMFDKARHIKRKSLKGKGTRNIFSKAEDLSLADNSTALLLEYSEEYPIMMSNVGMGSRVVNYYRRKAKDDTSRPKLEIGDLTVLLPEDKSPLTTFGHIDNGEITPTLHNGLYKAPLFHQEAKASDFLVIRSTTGVHGSRWFMRRIEHLRVVGQELPMVVVPGPHSRRVTTAAKHRLKMITYRMIRKSKSHRIGVGKITEHFADSTDMQNRQKMKEFMQFDKDHKEWKMRSGDNIPDKEAVRAMMNPDEVCLLESMQVGQQHLQDAGFSKEDDQSDDEAKEGQNIEQQLAPWYTSKNFNDAAGGKAMLQLHGEGDPSGRGEAFSFIKTSMKGGFKAMGESVAEKIESKRIKENNGHSYNVARQQQSYEESIRRIWDAQKHSLSLTGASNSSEIDDGDSLEDSDIETSARTIRSKSQAAKDSQLPEDEIGSQFTHLSSGSQNGKILMITRNIEDRYGNIEIVEDIVRNPRVIRQYLKRKLAREAESEPLSGFVPTGDAERDAIKQKLLQKELERLQRNKDRRLAREKQRGGPHADELDEIAGSPRSFASAASKTAGTQRKCANCGQIGHIKTNKKLCPMLNGTMKPEEGFRDSAFTASAFAP